MNIKTNEISKITENTLDLVFVLWGEKPPRNSARFCGGGQGLSWALEPRKEGKKGEVSYTCIMNMKYVWV
jgi:hypothetical protein